MADSLSLIKEVLVYSSEPRLLLQLPCQVPHRHSDALWPQKQGATLRDVHQTGARVVHQLRARAGGALAQGARSTGPRESTARPCAPWDKRRGRPGQQLAGVSEQQASLVNPALAELAKEGGCFDLPLALGLRAASGQIDRAPLDGLECAGEPSLAGAALGPRGRSPWARALRCGGSERSLVLSEACAAEVALVRSGKVLRAQHLLDLVAP